MNKGDIVDYNWNRDLRTGVIVDIEVTMNGHTVYVIQNNFTGGWCSRHGNEIELSAIYGHIKELEEL